MVYSFRQYDEFNLLDVSIAFISHRTDNLHTSIYKLTIKQLWGQYYRDVKASPDGTDHQNIRNFMKYGWEGVPFENGIALTKKNVGENEWDRDAESWIP